MGFRLWTWRIMAGRTVAAHPGRTDSRQRECPETLAQKSAGPGSGRWSEGLGRRLGLGLQMFHVEHFNTF